MPAPRYQLQMPKAGTDDPRWIRELKDRLAELAGAVNALSRAQANRDDGGVPIKIVDVADANGLYPCQVYKGGTDSTTPLNGEKAWTPAPGALTVNQWYYAHSIARKIPSGATSQARYWEVMATQPPDAPIDSWAGIITFCATATTTSWDVLVNDSIDWRGRITQSWIATAGDAEATLTPLSKYTAKNASTNLVTDGAYQLYVTDEGVLRVSCATVESTRMITILASGTCGCTICGGESISVTVTTPIVLTTANTNAMGNAKTYTFALGAVYTGTLDATHGEPCATGRMLEHDLGRDVSGYKWWATVAFSKNTTTCLCGIGFAIVNYQIVEDAWVTDPPGGTPAAAYLQYLDHEGIAGVYPVLFNGSGGFGTYTEGEVLVEIT